MKSVSEIAALRTTAVTCLTETIKFPDSPLTPVWELQGFGMYRTYLDDERIARLHVWDASDRVADVSDIHTHPWDFSSSIVWGTLINERYLEVPENGVYPHHMNMPAMRRLIKPGAKAHALGPDTAANLQMVSTEHYSAGATYSQQHHEIHRSIPIEPGTVSIVTRDRGDLPDEAYSYYHPDKSWVSAAPTIVKGEQLIRVCKRALAIAGITC